MTALQQKIAPGGFVPKTAAPDSSTDGGKPKAVAARMVPGGVLIRFSNGQSVLYDPEALWKHRIEPWNRLLPGTSEG